MNKAFIYSLLLLFSVFISSCSQIVLKKAAEKTHRNRLAEYLNASVIIAYGLFALAFLVSIYLVRYVPLSLVSVIDASGYVFILLLSRIFLKEMLSTKRILAAALIVLGIIVFYI
jgi:drug/metabolite transporter (DMT)-like permease